MSKRDKQVLGLVAEHDGGITVPEIAAALGVHQNVLYRVLPGLERKGFVEKSGRKWRSRAPVVSTRTTEVAMSTAVAGDLSDLELSDEERALEEAEERLKAERRAERKVTLSGMSDETLDAMADDGEAPYIDRALAREVLEERRKEFELAGESPEAEGEPGKAQELEVEAGEPVGPMPPAEPEPVIPPDQIVVRGTARGSQRKWNGKAPGSTVLALSVKVPVDGGFKKGERIKFTGEALVVSEGVKDKLDKDTKQPVEAVQTHEAVVLDFAVDGA